MSQKEFIRECTSRGHCNKKQAMAYCLKHIKDEYTESDLIDAYRYFQTLRVSDDNPNYDYISLDRSHGWRIRPRRPYYE